MQHRLNLVDDFVRLLIEGDLVNCRNIVSEYEQGEGDFVVLYEDLFRTSLYRIGHLWENCKISVATEHLATSITQSILNTVYRGIEMQESTPLLKIMAVGCRKSWMLSMLTATA